MGACNCNKNDLNEALGEDQEINKIINQQLPKDTSLSESKFAPNNKDQTYDSSLKRMKSELYEKLERSLKDYGKIISEQEFKSNLPKKYQQIMESSPYVPKKNVIPNENENEDGNDELVKFKPVKLKNGNIYWGEWNSENEMSGEGKYYLPDDEALAEGIWVNGIMKRGRVITKEGVYEGDIENNSYNGIGKMQYADGYTYNGEWFQGKKQGQGRLEWEDNSYYKGEFNDDKMAGKGIFCWNQLIIYEGDFYDNLFNGYGVLKNDKGSVYEGNFRNGFYHGKGNFEWGESSNNTNNNINNSMSNSNRNSVGMNGKTKYSGNYNMGKKEGIGKYYLNDFVYYDGKWLNNKMHGEGKIVTKHRTYFSFWRNGENVEKEKVNVKENSSLKSCKDGDGNNLDLNFVPRIEDIEYSKCPYLGIIPDQLGINEAKGEMMVPISQKSALESMYATNNF